MSTLSGTTSKNLWPFSPQSIPGLALWLDAADTNTLTSTTWKDKSGLGYVGTATAITSSTQNGLNAANLGTNQVVLSPSFIWQNAFTMFVVAKVTNQFFINMWSPSTADHSYGRNFMYTGNYDLMVVGGFGCDDSVLPLGTSVIPLGEYMIFVIGYNNGSVATPYAVNGTTRTTKNGSASYGSKTGEYTIIADSGGQIVAELIHFNNNLNTFQYQQVEGYLAKKWGLQSNLPATHPYYQYIPSVSGAIGTPVTNPLSITSPACILWMDAADASSYTASGGVVSAWRDKSSSAYTLNGSGSPTVVSAVQNGLPGMYINGYQSFVSSINFATTANQSITAFLVATNTINNNQDGPGLHIGTPASGRAYFGMLVYNRPSTSLIYVPSNWQDDNALDNTPSYYNVPLVLTALFNGSQFIGYYNQSQIGPKSTPSLNVTGTPVRLGYRGNYEGNGEFGYIFEAVIYNGALTTPQIQSVEAYLINKWGITVGQSTGSIIPKPVYQRAFLPVDIPGCSLWLDGADKSSITLSGSSVTAWNDKSGNGYSATGGVSPSYSSNAVQFNGSSYLSTSAPATSNSATYFITFTPIISGSTVPLGGNALNSATFLVSATNLVFSDWNTNVATLTTTISTGTTYIASAMANGGTLSIGVNGGSMASGAATFSGSGTFTIGAGYTDNRYKYSGSINEIIIFNTALTISQRQQVESYLAWKWGLISSLATGHPGKSLPAFTMSFNPKSISGMSIWVDAADSASMVFASGTKNLVKWSDKSGNGNHFNTSEGTPVLNTTTIGNPGVFFPQLSQMASTSNAAVSGSGSRTTFFVADVQSGYEVHIGTGSIGSTRQVWGFDWWRKSGDGMTCPYTWGDDISFSRSTSTTSFIGYAAINSSVSNVIYGNMGTTSTDTVRTLGGSLNIQAGPWWMGDRPSSGTSGYGGGSAYYGWICEFMEFNSFLSTSDRQKVEGYLAWKWGLQSNLPSTHAYAKFKP